MIRATTVCASLWLAACATPAPNLAISSASWRADLQFLKRELPRRHINAFHAVSRSVFDAALDRLIASAPNQNSDQRLVGLLGAVNLIGDGHTGVILPPDRAYFPIEIRQFGSAFRVTRVAPGYERALGAMVVRIGETPVAQVMEEVGALTPSDENDSLRQAIAADDLSVGVILHGLNIIPERSVGHYSFQTDDGQTFDMELPASATRDKSTWLRPSGHVLLSDQHPGEPFWCTYLNDASAVYCDFRSYDDLAAHGATMLELISQTAPDRLVIDLRGNGGGDYTVGEHDLIEPIARLPSLNRRGHLYVLIGPQTFSAAMNNAAQFRSETAATLVGETIGEKPNSYQEPRELPLPNSKLVVRYSTRWYAFVQSGRNAIEPDVPILPSWTVYAAGQDAALDYALSSQGELAAER